MESRKRKFEEKETECKLHDFLAQYRHLFRGFEVPVVGSDYHSLLAVVHHGRDDFVRYLVQERRVDVDGRFHYSWTPLMFAVEKRHLSTARLLLQLGADISLRDANGRNVLRYAAVNEDYPMIRMLIDHGAEMTPADRRGLDVEIIDFVRNLLMEKRFSKVITGGICSNGQFRDFLAEGVCDARLLIHVANFAYR